MSHDDTDPSDVDPSDLDAGEITLAYDENRPVVYVEYEGVTKEFSPSEARSFADRIDSGVASSTDPKASQWSKVSSHLRKYADKAGDG